MNIQNRVNPTLFLYLLLLTGFFLLKWPVPSVDTDLWYHLDGGRYFFSHMEIFKTSYFSFLTPEREFVNYFWLFQVLAYLIHSASGYYGLIFLRTLAFLSMLFFIYRILRKNQAPIIFPIVLMLCPVLLIERSCSIRPHMFSYLFIAMFIYAWELHPRKIVYLIPAALLWVNFHGIEYPVMILIVTAYLSEIFIKRFREGADSDANDQKILFLSFLIMASIFFTPHNIKLMTLPFQSTADASQYINELKPFEFEKLLSFEIDHLTPTFPTFLNIFLLVSIAVVGLRIWKQEMRPAHFFLFLGALFLLSKGNRFISEFVLLSLPALGTCRLFEKQDPVKISGTAYFIAVIGILFFTTGYYFRCFPDPSSYPVSNENLPKGVATFLKAHGKGGSILNFPDKGGYLRWELHPDYKIAMDMEVPFFFSDEDFYLISNSFFNEPCFEIFVRKYHPEYISVPLQLINPFQTWIKRYPEYQLVFFDDNEALYINNQSFPDIADRFRLMDVDPVRLARLNPGRLEGSIKKRYLQELKGMHDIYPESKLINTSIAMLLLQDNEYEEAKIHADLIIRYFPESAGGYLTKGEILTSTGKFDEAIACYKKALKKIHTSEKRNDVYRQLWICFNGQGAHKKAFRILRDNLSIYRDETSYMDLYRIGYSAIQTGNRKEALKVMTYAYMKVPSEDREWKNRIGKVIHFLTP